MGYQPDMPLDQSMEKRIQEHIEREKSHGRECTQEEAFRCCMSEWLDVAKRSKDVFIINGIAWPLRALSYAVEVLFDRVDKLEQRCRQLESPKQPERFL
jgi:hypothetical protein